VKVLYFVASGKSDPSRASIPFHLAVNGSLEVGDEPAIVVAGDAADLLGAGVADSIEAPGLPPLRDLLAKVCETDVSVHVCKACAVARGIGDDALPGVNGAWVSAPDVAKLIAAADRTVTF
jgi:uncharacterized protein involved in oxidation of intracellular sulfur